MPCPLPEWVFTTANRTKRIGKKELRVHSKVEKVQALSGIGVEQVIRCKKFGFKIPGNRAKRNTIGYIIFIVQ